MNENLPVKRARGRPKGSKSATTLLREKARSEILAKAGDLMLRDVEKVVKKTLEMALAGDMKAIQLILDRTIPSRKAVEHLNAQGTSAVQINISGVDIPKPIEGEVIEN